MNRILAALCNRVPELQDLLFYIFEWKRALMICIFLQNAASIKLLKYRSVYLTLSVNKASFEHLLNKFRKTEQDNDMAILPAAKSMLEEAECYEEFVCSDLARKANVLYPRFWNSIPRERDFKGSLFPQLKL